jgi:hypothetical protein
MTGATSGRRCFECAVARIRGFDVACPTLPDALAADARWRLIGIAGCGKLRSRRPG